MLPYVAHDPRFSRLVIGHANLESLPAGAAGRRDLHILPRADT
jgi:hypothetical protein